MNNSQHFQEMFRRKVVNYSAVNHGRVQPATPFTAPAFLDTLQISMKTDKAFYPIDTKSVSMSLNNNNSKVLFLGCLIFMVNYQIVIMVGYVLQ